MRKIYLDHNATTPLDPEVLESMLPIFREVFGNPSSPHSEGRAARVQVDEAREKAAGLIGAHPSEIIFTSGGTESNNFAILGTALAFSGKGRHIITCRTEHLSVLNPCRQLLEQGFQIETLPVDRQGRIDLDELKEKITDSTVLISIQHANSETGTLQDIDKIGEMARERGVLFHTDAVQSVGKIPVDLEALPVDMLSISAHKLYGPKGVGALFLRRGCPKLFSPVCGGSQEKKRRGGTENVPGIVGFGKACELAELRLEQGTMKRVAEIRDRLAQGIQNTVSDVEFFGHPQYCLPNTLGAGFEGAGGETLLIGLDMEGIAVSTGSACSSGSALPSHVLTSMDVPVDLVNSSLRFSLGWGNTAEEMDEVSEALGRIVPENRKKKQAIL
ncbi:MAG: cysteine desulfurase family protein [Nitrospinaceae bacterium]